MAPMRTEHPPSGPERGQLCGLLDRLRETVLLKTDGLTKAQLGQELPPSSLTLAGLLNHLALVEDWWFRVRFLGVPENELWRGLDWDADPEYEFRTALELDPAELYRRYHEACERSREVVAGADLDALSGRAAPDGRRWDLRWVLLHMIEETARHAGHADLLREAVDGAVGH